jgi:hypothetical protein
MRQVIVLLALVGLGCNGASLWSKQPERRLTVIVTEVPAARVLLPPDQSIAADRVPCFDEGWQTCIALSCVKPQEVPIVQPE